MEQRLIEEIKRLRSISCRGDDPTCPCHDGDACHYRGENAWKTPLEKEVERLRTQCDGLGQAALNNGQDLLLKENEVERLRADSESRRLLLEASNEAMKLQREENERLRAELATARTVIDEALRDLHMGSKQAAESTLRKGLKKEP